MSNQRKVTISTSISNLADECLDLIVDNGHCSNRSNAVETSSMLLFYVLNNEQIMKTAKKMGIVEKG